MKKNPTSEERAKKIQEIYKTKGKKAAQLAFLLEINRILTRG